MTRRFNDKVAHRFISRNIIASLVVLLASMTACSGGSSSGEGDTNANGPFLSEDGALSLPGLDHAMTLMKVMGSVSTSMMPGFESGGECPTMDIST